jgi:hypothetical protein
MHDEEENFEEAGFRISDDDNLDDLEEDELNDDFGLDEEDPDKDR